jgi:hypothetical protein
LQPERYATYDSHYECDDVLSPCEVGAHPQFAQHPGQHEGAENRRTKQHHQAGNQSDCCRRWPSVKDVQVAVRQSGEDCGAEPDENTCGDGCCKVREECNSERGASPHDGLGNRED